MRLLAVRFWEADSSAMTTLVWVVLAFVDCIRVGSDVASSRAFGEPSSVQPFSFKVEFRLHLARVNGRLSVARVATLEIIL